MSVKCMECGSEDEVKQVTMDLDLPTLTLCFVCRFLLMNPELERELNIKKNGSGRSKRPNPSN